MIGLLGDLSDWLVGFAGSDWAILVLAVTTFFESIFFPVPPDPLLVGIGILQPHLAIWLGVLVTAFSVAGAMVGYWLGKRLGRPIAARLFPEAGVQVAERLFKRYGMWAILIAAFTPIPYKVFAISAGVLELDRRTFLVASIIGRGARFITIGVLVLLFGESIQAFIAGNFGVLTLVMGAGVVAAAIVWVLVHRRRRARRESDAGTQATDARTGSS